MLLERIAGQVWHVGASGGHECACAFRLSTSCHLPLEDCPGHVVFDPAVPLGSFVAVFAQAVEERLQHKEQGSMDTTQWQQVTGQLHHLLFCCLLLLLQARSCEDDEPRPQLQSGPDGKLWIKLLLFRTRGPWFFCLVYVNNVVGHSGPELLAASIKQGQSHEFGASVFSLLERQLF